MRRPDTVALVAWAMRKYRRLKGHKIRASRFLEQLSEKKPYLFVHWQKRHGRCVCLMGAV
jgi:hypothetical protein